MCLHFPTTPVAGKGLVDKNNVHGRDSNPSHPSLRPPCTCSRMPLVSRVAGSSSFTFSSLATSSFCVLFINVLVQVRGCAGAWVVRGWVGGDACDRCGCMCAVPVGGAILLLLYFLHLHFCRRAFLTPVLLINS